MGDRLVTRSFICILAANFLLYFGFWLLVPVLPFYLKETFSCGEAAVGTILSCYTVSTLCTRPFMGYLYDGFARKPIYIMAYLLFTAIFAGYVLTSLLAVFILLRAVHGVAFGTVTVGGNTLVIDITPSNRRGEALGYYGLTNNVAMSIGPMTGLFLHDSHLRYGNELYALFRLALASPPVLNTLSLLVTITRRTVLQKVRHHTLTCFDCL